jgi:hypothetical protein
MADAELEDVVESSLSDDLAAAWADSEGDQDGGEHQAEAGQSSVPDDISAERNTDVSGVDERGADGAAVAGGGRPGDDKKPTAGDGESAKPPVSWNAEAREAWKDIPKAARDYIAQREQQVAVGMQKNAEGANRAAAMDRTLQPYSQYLAMNGGPGETIKNLLATGANLQMGSPVQKAHQIANLIKQFGVDITTLDNILVGQPAPKEHQQNDAVQLAVQQAVAPYQQMLQEFQQGRQQQVEQFNGQVKTELQQFQGNAANEFYADVKMDMADILDMAANRGQQMDLATAYDRACKLHPSISKILDTRAAASIAAKKRDASVSIHGNRGGDGASQPDSMRAAIEEAWAGQGG